VTLAAPVAITGGDITIAGPIDSAPNRGYSLTLTPGKGKTAVLSGDIGATNPPGGLAITANRILSNSISSNGGKNGVGISLIGGGNNAQPAPTVTSAVLNGAGTDLTVQFTLTPLPAGAYTAQVFYTPSAPAQGQQLLDTYSDLTNATVTRTIPVSSAVTAGGYITVTATPASDDTSAFSTGALIAAGA
jgi:hypothetical protein